MSGGATMVTFVITSIDVGECWEWHEVARPEVIVRNGECCCRDVLFDTIGMATNVVKWYSAEGCTFVFESKMVN